MSSYYCLITQNTIQINDALTYVGDQTHGAVCHFVGVVRNHNEGKAVKGIDYEVCQPLTTHVLEQIALETSIKFPEVKIYIAHYEGYLNVGEVSMLVSTSTPHRGEAYQSNRYIVEAIKHKCPVWKKEYYQDGSISWVKGCKIEHEHLIG